MLRDRGVVRPGRGAGLPPAAARLLADAAYGAIFAVAWPLILRRIGHGRLAIGHLRERFGASPRLVPPGIWIHAVSVGEVGAAEPLVRAIERAIPGLPIAISTTTETGRAVAAKRLAPRPVFHWPLDFGFAVRRALRRTRPRALVLIELELWPNMLLAARAARVPVIIANGRITERSVPGLSRVARAVPALVDAVAACAARDADSADRFARIGISPDRIRVLGNLKFDAPTPASGSAPVRERLGWPADAIVWVAGSTHPGEEEAILDAFVRLRADAPRLRLVIAPRHVERAAGLADAIAGRGLSAASWTRGGAGEMVGLVDTVGELDSLYGAADVVFVGGSLIPRGGHNLLEPARWGKPVVFGPSFENFVEIAEILLAADAALRLDGPAALEAAVRGLVADPGARERLGRRALEAIGRHQGAADRHAALIRETIGL
ncbi:MAG: 3-deoxy-D-manno-octulosonic acid transferase [Planctomycetes bacterium]|nr:3-deoxy-D-manno-octulosonic acid transferase [Planctomycetota bacterium]